MSKRSRRRTKGFPSHLSALQILEGIVQTGAEQASDADLREWYRELRDRGSRVSIVSGKIIVHREEIPESAPPVCAVPSTATGEA